MYYVVYAIEFEGLDIIDFDNFNDAYQNYINDENAIMLIKGVQYNDKLKKFEDFVDN